MSHGGEQLQCHVAAVVPVCRVLLIVVLAYLYTSVNRA